jgi:hypothetical protein
MLNRLYKLTTIGVLASLLFAMLVVSPVAAQDQPNVAQQEQTTVATPGVERATAGPPFAEQIQLNSGETHWYKFRYTFDDNLDDEAQNAVVALKMDTIGCVTFDVTTSGRLNFPFDDEGELIGPVGRGTAFNTGGDDPEDSNPAFLVWVGSAEASETYFVIVKHHGDNPCLYNLSITGAPVVF